MSTVTAQRLRFHADRMEAQGHVTAARWMRVAAGELSLVTCIVCKDVVIPERQLCRCCREMGVK